MSTRFPGLGDVDLRPRPRLPEITVVIPTLGREILEASLAAIAAGTRWPAGIVLAHQGSGNEVVDWSARLARAGLPVLHLPSRERGRARGVNLGLSRVETRFAAITDDDCLVAADWLERMADHLRRAPDRIVTGRVEPAGEEEVVALVRSRTPAVRSRPLLRHDSLSGGNMGAAVSVLARVGPLDEDPALATAEDCEYSYRALRSGVPIEYAPDVLVRHVGWRAEAERGAQYDSYARSYGAFLGKYLRRGDAFIAARALASLARSGRRWASGWLLGDTERAAHGRAYLLGLLPGIARGWGSAPPPRGTEGGPGGAAS